MNDETQSHPKVPDLLTQAVNELETALASIEAPFRIHIAQKQALQSFWRRMHPQAEAAASLPVASLPLNGKRHGKPRIVNPDMTRR